MRPPAKQNITTAHHAKMSNAHPDINYSLPLHDRDNPAEDRVTDCRKASDLLHYTQNVSSLGCVYIAHHVDNTAFFHSSSSLYY